MISALFSQSRQIVSPGGQKVRMCSGCFRRCLRHFWRFADDIIITISVKLIFFILKRNGVVWWSGLRRLGSRVVVIWLFRLLIISPLFHDRQIKFSRRKLAIWLRFHSIFGGVRKAGLRVYGELLVEFSFFVVRHLTALIINAGRNLRRATPLNTRLPQTLLTTLPRITLQILRMILYLLFICLFFIFIIFIWIILIFNILIVTLMENTILVIFEFH